MMDMFDNYEVRMRITEKGHLIEEVKGLFSNAVPSYRNDEWITVWSTAPIHHNTTIGIPSILDRHISYKLVLEKNGHLSLYDAVGVMIWCSGQGCNHASGYRFPEVYLVPTNFETLSDTTGKDKHNSMPKNVKKRRGNQLLSIAEGCDQVLEENDALVSKNGRFKFYLESSGNLVLKDVERTMWESSSGNLNFSKPPYEALLTPTGNLVVLDSVNDVVWTSKPNRKVNESLLKSDSWPLLELSDKGKLSILYNITADKDVDEDGVVWESWPTRNLSLGATLLKRIAYEYVPCHGTKISNVTFDLSNSYKKLRVRHIKECWQKCFNSETCKVYVNKSLDLNQKEIVIYLF